MNAARTTLDSITVDMSMEDRINALIVAMSEQQDEIRNLQETVEAQESYIAELQDRVDDLEG